MLGVLIGCVNVDRVSLCQITLQLDVWLLLPILHGSSQWRERYIFVKVLQINVLMEGLGRNST